MAVSINKKSLIGILFVMMFGAVLAQTTGTSSTTGGTTTGTTSLINQGTYDSKTLVDTNSTSNSVSTVNSNSTATSNSNATSTSTVNSTSTNTNNNNNASTSTSTNVNTNNNVNTGDMTNRNISTSTSQSVNTNNNVNQNANINQNINSGEVTNINKNETVITQRVIQPPPTAVAPAMMSGGNNDLCSTGSSGSVQTQIFGVSSGGTIRDLNCERLKLSKTLFDMGMKVAAVATMCQDRRVFDAMMAAGTPCPYEGKIGEQAKAAWEENKDKIPQLEKEKKYETAKNVGFGSLLGILVHAAFK